MKSHSLLRSIVVLTASAFLVLVLISSAYSQQGTSSVRGVVTDPQGNVVAGATVTLVNPGTNVSRATTTSDAGAYSFDFVQASDYRVEVEAKGFKKSVTTDVHALVAKPTPVDVQLEIGDITQ